MSELPYHTTGKALVCPDFPGEVDATTRAIDNKGAMGETNVVPTVGTLLGHALDPVGFQSNRVFKLWMCGEPGSNYVREVNINIPSSNWVAVGTVENTNGIWRYFDTATTNAALKFYRARQC